MDQTATNTSLALTHQSQAIPFEEESELSVPNLLDESNHLEVTFVTISIKIQHQRDNQGH